jgi:hypothetical protein
MVQHVTAHHLSRLACLYVRQSTLQQVFENRESTAHQYALRERARALGWAEERIIVIDQDLGHSGTSTADRLGFQWLVAEVGLGRVGLVLGLEVSLLARQINQRARVVTMHPCRQARARGTRCGHLRGRQYQREAIRVEHDLFHAHVSRKQQELSSKSSK